MVVEQEAGQPGMKVCFFQAPARRDEKCNTYSSQMHREKKRVDVECDETLHHREMRGDGVCWEGRGRRGDGVTELRGGRKRVGERENRERPFTVFLWFLARKNVTTCHEEYSWEAGCITPVLTLCSHHPDVLLLPPVLGVWVVQQQSYFLKV